MGLSIDSSGPSIRESTTGGSPLGPLPLDSSGLEGLDLHFTQSGGYFRKETEALFPAVADVSDADRAFLASQYLPKSPAPHAPETTDSSRIPGSSRLDKLYAPDFRRLDLGLEALKAKQANVPLPKVHIYEGDVPALEAGKAKELHVPSYVPEGNVPTLGVVDVKAEGELVFGSELVERNAGLTK